MDPDADDLRRVIMKASNASGLKVVDDENAMSVEVRKPPGVQVRVVVPHQVLEWSVSIESEGRVLWQDWADYSGYDAAPAEQLRLAMHRDVGWFLGILAYAQGMRVDIVRHLFVFRRPVAYWLVDGHWSPVSLAERPVRGDGVEP